MVWQSDMFMSLDDGVVVVCAISVMQLVLVLAIDIIVWVVLMASHDHWRQQSIPHLHLSLGLTGHVTFSSTSDVQLGLPAGPVRGPPL